MEKLATHQDVGAEQDAARRLEAYIARLVDAAPPLTPECAANVHAMPPLPMSRSAVDALGKRLAAATDVTDDDLDMLLEILSAYQLALAETQERLRVLGFSPTSRTKTTGVLIDKLRREHSSLKSVQDIAGTRILCCDRKEQDEIVSAVVRCFADGSRAPKVRDRRVEPSYGYRAVHVVVTVQDLPVEIQVRTERQDRWAQIVESLGDSWGRQIRYGELPLDPDRVIDQDSVVTRRELWAHVSSLADHTDAVERWQVAVAKILDALESAAGMSPESEDAIAAFAEEALMKTELAEAEAELSKDLEFFVRISERLE